MHLKYFDDVSLVEALNLKVCLKEDHRPQEKPLNFHSRTGHMFIEDKTRTIQKLQEIKKFAKTNQMSINSQKTKLMFINKSLKYDSMPEIQVTLGENLEVVEEYEILWIIVSTDMKWNKHVDYICKRGYSQLWTLRRLKKLGASSKILIDIYEKHIRS